MSLHPDFSNDDLLVLAVRELTSAVIEGLAGITAVLELHVKEYPRNRDTIIDDMILAMQSGHYDQLHP